MITQTEAIRLAITLAWMAGHSAVSIESATKDVSQIIKKLSSILKEVEINFDNQNKDSVNKNNA